MHPPPPPAPGLTQLLAQGMGLEVHWFPGEASPASLAPILAGMANTRGGTVVLGVSPRSGQAVGVREPQDAMLRVLQAAMLLDPPLVLPMPTLQPCGPVSLLVVAVPAGLPNVYSLDGRYLGREGRHTGPLPASALRELLLTRSAASFEARMPPQAATTDLDPNLVTQYLEKLFLPQQTSPEEALLRRGCLLPDGPTLRPTYAALLLFGHHPQQWLPNAAILAARFSGVAFSERYLKLDAGGPLPQQLRQAEQFARDNLRRVVRLVGLTHQETPEYPPEAVRELLVNAAAHRDYSLQGDTIHLHIFADRLEVLSPGGLPGPVTLGNLLTTRFSRNPILVQVLADLGFVERLGYGLNRVVTEARQNGLPDPTFEEDGGRFRVTLRGAEPGPPPLDFSRYKGMELNPRQEQLLAYLASHPRITNRAYQELCPDVHPETLRRDLADLVQRKVLLKIGTKRATYYILKG